MGRYGKSGLFPGTRDSGQMEIGNFSYETKVKELEKRFEKEDFEREELREGIAELKKLGVKFNEADVLFVAKDQSGQTIWLEKGNDDSGLKHIISKHSEDFKNKLGISEAMIAKTIKDVINSGEIKYQKLVKKKGKDGYEKLYKYRGKYYLIAGIGLNGFVISIYPTNDKEALKLMRRNENGKRSN